MDNASHRRSRAKLEEIRRLATVSPNWMRRLGYYGLALLFVGVAAMLRSALWDALAPVPILVFYLAWVGAAAFGGLGPGLLATVASWLCIDFLFDPTPGQIGFVDPTSIARLLVLLAGGLIVSLVGEKMRRTRIRERRQGRKLAGANAVLRESQERLRQRAEEVETLMDLIPAAIWVAHDPQCNHITGNQTANKLYEAHEQENVSANVSPARRFFRDGRELQPEELPMQAAAAQNIEIRDSEVDVLLPSGKWRNMLGSAGPLHDAEGRVRGCIAAFMDVTARRQAEQALRERMKELACLYAVTHDMQEDFSLEELCRRAVEHLVPAMQFPEITAAVLELNEKRFTSENYAEGLSRGLQAEIRVEGEVVGHLRVYYAQERPFLIPEEQNLVDSVAAALSTWLVRRRAEEALRGSERRLSLAQQIAHVGTFDWDIRTGVNVWTPELEAMYGLPPGGFGRTQPAWEQLVHPQDRAQAVRLVEQALEAGAPTEGQWRVVWPDASIHWLAGRWQVFKDESGRPVRMTGVNIDITARVQAEDALRESEQRLALALNGTQIGMYDRDVASGEARGTEQLARLLGLRTTTTTTTTTTTLSQAYHYHDWTERVHPEDLARVEAELRRCMTEHGSCKAEYRVVWPDGSVHWIADRGVFEYEAEGRCTRMLGVVMDVTERQQAEAALRNTLAEAEEGRRILEAMMEHIPMGITIADTPDVRIRAVSRYGRELTGKPREQIESIPVGQHAERWQIFRADGVTPATNEELPLTRATQQGELVEHEEWVIGRPDGTRIPVLCTAAPIRDAQGNITGGVIGWQDISQRKQAEEALRRSERQFKSTFENAAIGIAHVALDGHILQSNGRFCEITGYSCEDILGKTCERITLTDDWKAEEVQMQRLLDGRVDHYAIEKRYIRRDGGLVWVNLTRSIQRDEAGRPEYFIVLVEDISVRRRAEERLRELTATLESKVFQRTAELRHRARQLQKLTLDMSVAEDRERERMAAILHDDLQQVLAAAKFHVGLMRSRARSDVSLQATGARVDHMLKEAIDKSRSLSHELSPAVMHHADFAETLCWLANEVQTKHGLMVRVHVHGPVGSQSDALKAFLFRAVQELLFNVVKHARVNEARIRVRRLGRCLCLSVSDHGRGFDPQALGETAGYGLLSIRERIELLGGRMTIKSAPGKGSTFRIVVPEGEPVAAPLPSGEVKTTQPREAGLPAEGRLRVLVADDHEIVRQGLTSLLSEEHTVTVVGEAGNGREAIDLAHRLRPDVVIMDVSMPLIDGDEATRQIKTYLPQTRVIALSMYDEADKKERMYRAGAESYVLKTAPSEELVAAIRGE